MIVLVGKKMEMRLNILIVMIMAAYLSQKMMTILMFVEEFCTYNPNSASPHFCIGMLFKDGEQFKSVIRKYSMCCRRELKIIRNEPNRVRVKCIAS
ncbi:hypothetical protein Golax_021835, partial [Gossypium laxum]|nr:hypothetical protein [Gossypium laxum]